MPLEDEEMKDEIQEETVFPIEASFDDNTHPAIFTFTPSSAGWLKMMRADLLKKLKEKFSFWQRIFNKNIENWIIIENNQLKFSSDACKAGAIELFFNSYDYGDSYQADQLRQAISYLSYRASRTESYYSFFGRLFGGVSRKIRCDTTWDFIKKTAQSILKKIASAQSSTSNFHTAIKHYDLIEQADLYDTIVKKIRTGNEAALARLLNFAKKDELFPPDKERNILDDLVKHWPHNASLTNMLNLFTTRLFPTWANQGGQWVTLDLRHSHHIYNRAEYLGYLSFQDRTKKTRIKTSIDHLGIQCCHHDLVVFNKDKGYRLFLLPNELEKLNGVLNSIEQTIKDYEFIEIMINDELKKYRADGTNDHKNIEHLNNLKFKFYKACACPAKDKVLETFNEIIKTENTEKVGEGTAYQEFRATIQQKVESIINKAPKIAIQVDKKGPETGAETIVPTSTSVEKKLSGTTPIDKFKQSCRDALKKANSLQHLSLAANQAKEEKCNEFEVKKTLYEAVRTLPDLLLESGKSTETDPLLVSVIEDYQRIKRGPDASIGEEPHPLIKAIKQRKPIKEIKELLGAFGYQARDIRDVGQKTLIDNLLLNNGDLSFLPKDQKELQPNQFFIKKSADGSDSFVYEVKDCRGRSFSGKMVKANFQTLFSSTECDDIYKYIDDGNNVNLKRSAPTFFKYFSKQHSDFNKVEDAYLEEVLEILVENDVPVNRVLNKRNFSNLYYNHPTFFKKILPFLIEAGSRSKPEFSESERNNLGLIHHTYFSSVASYLIQRYNENRKEDLAKLIDDLFLEKDKKEAKKPTAKEMLELRRTKKWSQLSSDELKKEIIKWGLIFDGSQEGTTQELMKNFSTLMDQLLTDCLEWPREDKRRSNPISQGNIPAEMVAIFFKETFGMKEGGSDALTCGLYQSPSEYKKASPVLRSVKDHKDAITKLMTGHSPTHKLIQKTDSIIVDMLIQNRRYELAIYLTTCPALCQLKTSEGETWVDYFMKKTHVNETNIADTIRTLKLLIEDHQIPANKILSSGANGLTAFIKQCQGSSARAKLFSANIALILGSMAHADVASRSLNLDDKVIEGLDQVRRFEKIWKSNNRIVQNINELLAVVEKENKVNIGTIKEKIYKSSSSDDKKQEMLAILKNLFSELTDKKNQGRLLDPVTIALSFAFNKILTQLYKYDNTIDLEIQHCLTEAPHKKKGFFL